MFSHYQMAAILDFRAMMMSKSQNDVNHNPHNQFVTKSVFIHNCRCSGKNNTFLTLFQDDASGHFGFGIFGRDMGAKYFIKGE